MLEEDCTRLWQALRFAADKHRFQRRKDHRGSAYINHPIAVAETLWRVGQVRDYALLIAALLHDVLEDTETDPQELQARFGEEILGLVREVSDDKDLPRAERKRLQVVHAARISRQAQQIKLADKICNLDDILHYPPADWPPERKLEYLSWSDQVIAGVQDCNPALEAHYWELSRRARIVLDRPSP